MRGRFRTQPFLVESLRGSRQSPQRNFSPAPLGKSIAPSSVTFGDSFPPRGSLWVVQPYPKKRPKSGHVHGHRNSPTTAPLRYPTPKPASGNERAIKKGGPGGKAPGALSSGFLRRKPGSRPESGGKPPRRCQPAPVQARPPCRPGRPLNSPAIIPESRPDDNQRERLACRKQARPAVSGLLEKCILEISIGSALCYPGDSSPGGIFLGPIA